MGQEIGMYEIGRDYDRSAAGYSPGMARGEPTKTIGHARAGGEKALTVPGQFARSRRSR
jgi:hypothetical protein